MYKGLSSKVSHTEKTLIFASFMLKMLAAVFFLHKRD